MAAGKSPFTRRSGFGGASFRPIKPRRDPIFTGRSRRVPPTEPGGKAPLGWNGTYPEWVAFQALLAEGLEPGKDFSLQTSLLGGRRELGGVVIDFLLIDPPRGINIQGAYWHYQRGARTSSLERLQQAAVMARGIPIVYIDDDDLLRDPRYFIREALAGHDHSSMTRGH